MDGSYCTHVHYQCKETELQRIALCVRTWVCVCVCPYKSLKLPCTPLS